MAKLELDGLRLSKAFRDLKTKAVQKIRENSSVTGESARINTHRVYYLAMLAIPVRIVNILQFVGKLNDASISKVWSRGIIASHVILMVFMIGFLIIAGTLRRAPGRVKAQSVLQYVVMAVIMAAGIAIVALDQLVTASIMPFFFICVVCGAIFLIRPLISGIIFVVSYLAFYFLMAVTVTDPSILLSNRVNGVTAVAIGFLLSFTLWRYNCTNILQKRCIERQQKQLEDMAYYDPLTGLPNRRLLERIVKKELAAMGRYGHETVLIILDIDDFKIINDTYGHIMGDSILRQVSVLLKENVRDTDTVSRFGGEEFVILLPRTTVEEGYELAERLRKCIMDEKFAGESATMQITTSFGVSSLRETESRIFEDYIHQADKALYLAKQGGKNRVEKAESRA